MFESLSKVFPLEISTIKDQLALSIVGRKFKYSQLIKEHTVKPSGNITSAHRRLTLLAHKQKPSIIMTVFAYVYRKRLFVYSWTNSRFWCLRLVREHKLIKLGY